MDIQEIYRKFAQGINWNAFLFVTHKILFLTLSLLLYRNLCVHDFSVWANINSVVFLILLWADFGFRKSVPRYAPEFAKNKHAMRQFVRSIIFFQGTVFCVLAPLVFFLAPRIALSFGLEQHVSVLYLASVLLVVEGSVAVLRLIFHSYFWQKQFNLLSSILLTAQLGISVTLIYMPAASNNLLYAMFAIKIMTGIIIIIISLIMLTWLYKDKNYPGHQKVAMRATAQAFVKHSGVMWGNNCIKSLTERNFLVPLFTYVLGPQLANLFKIANDCALFFQRIVLKTIGTTDTALLSHVQTSPDGKAQLPIAFKKLTTKITSLSVPLLGIIALLFFRSLSLFKHNYVFQLFFILTVCYLIHTLLSPYERVLEVKRRYLYLALCYSLYVFMIGAFILFDLMTFLGLLGSIICIHVVRLVSSCIMVYLARRQFGLRFPVRFALSLFGISVLSVFFVYWFFVSLVVYMVPLLPAAAAAQYWPTALLSLKNS